MKTMSGNHSLAPSGAERFEEVKRQHRLEQQCNQTDSKQLATVKLPHIQQQLAEFATYTNQFWNNLLHYTLFDATASNSQQQQQTRIPTDDTEQIESATRFCISAMKKRLEQEAKLPVRQTEWLVIDRSLVDKLQEIKKGQRERFIAQLFASVSHHFAEPIQLEPQMFKAAIHRLREPPQMVNEEGCVHTLDARRSTIAKRLAIRQHMQTCLGLTYTRPYVGRRPAKRRRVANSGSVAPAAHATALASAALAVDGQREQKDTKSKKWTVRVFLPVHHVTDERRLERAWMIHQSKKTVLCAKDNQVSNYGLGHPSLHRPCHHTAEEAASEEYVHLHVLEHHAIHCLHAQDVDLLQQQTAMLGRFIAQPLVQRTMSFIRSVVPPATSTTADSLVSPNRKRKHKGDPSSNPSSLRSALTDPIDGQ
jgi:hypothetical protein